MYIWTIPATKQKHNVLSLRAKEKKGKKEKKEKKTKKNGKKKRKEKENGNRCDRDIARAYRLIQQAYYYDYQTAGRMENVHEKCENPEGRGSCHRRNGGEWGYEDEPDRVEENVDTVDSENT